MTGAQVNGGELIVKQGGAIVSRVSLNGLDYATDVEGVIAALDDRGG